MISGGSGFGPPGPSPGSDEPMAVTGATARGRAGRRVSAALFRRPGAKLALLLAPPLLWMILVYLSALSLLLVTSFWRLNELTSEIERVWGLRNFETLWRSSVYRTITFLTTGMAAAVTVTDLASVVELPHPGVLVAHHHCRGGPTPITPRGVRHPSVPGGEQLGCVADLLLSVAPFRDPPDLRGAREAARLAA